MYTNRICISVPCSYRYTMPSKCCILIFLRWNLSLCSIDLIWIKIFAYMTDNPITKTTIFLAHYTFANTAISKTFPKQLKAIWKFCKHQEQSYHDEYTVSVSFVERNKKMKMDINTSKKYFGRKCIKIGSRAKFNNVLAVKNWQKMYTGEYNIALGKWSQRKVHHSNIYWGPTSIFEWSGIRNG